MRAVSAAGRVTQRAVAEVGQARATITYVFTLAVTTFTVQGANPHLVHRLIVAASTNLHNMVRDPVQVLVSSAFWLQGGWPALGVAVLCVLVMVPAERWLGPWRWTGVFAAGHIGATVLTVTGIAVALHHGLLPAEEARAVDVGMSYGVAALAGMLTYRWATVPARLAWAGTWLAGLGVAAGLGQTFTDYGHVSAVLIGMALYPLARGDTVAGSPTRTVQEYPDAVREGSVRE